MSKAKKQLNLRQFKFLTDRVLVKALKSESVDGLTRPDQYEDKPEFGEVIAVGPGKVLDDGTNLPMTLKPGDIILFGKYSSVQIRNNGEDFYIIRQEDVDAVQ